MGAALCVRKGSLVGLEFLQSALPERGQKALKIVLSIIICAMLVFLISVGFWAVRRVCFQITPVLKQSMGLMYSGGVSFYADQSDYYNDLFDQGG